MKKAIICILAAAPLASAAVAKPVDNYVATLIQERAYGSAEDALSSQLARTPDNARALLNLAYVFEATDRRHEAASLYAHVLAIADVPVRTASGTTTTSHRLAETAMARPTSLASR